MSIDGDGLHEQLKAQFASSSLNIGVTRNRSRTNDSTYQLQVQ